MHKMLQSIGWEPTMQTRTYIIIYWDKLNIPQDIAASCDQCHTLQTCAWQKLFSPSIVSIEGIYFIGEWSKCSERIQTANHNWSLVNAKKSQCGEVPCRGALDHLSTCCGSWTRDINVAGVTHNTLVHIAWSQQKTLRCYRNERFGGLISIILSCQSLVLFAGLYTSSIESRSIHNSQHKFRGNWMGNKLDRTVTSFENTHVPCLLEAQVLPWPPFERRPRVRRIIWSFEGTRANM